MAYVISAPPVPTVAVAGTKDVFPVRRIYCVGRNYAEHVREMGHDVREPPFFFQKPADAIIPDGADFPYPSRSSDVHHEIELVAALKSGGANIATDRALDHVFGYAVGLDMTRRDLQGQMKKMGKAWEVGKAFERAAPVGTIQPVSKVGHPAKGKVWLNVNGKERQKGDLTEMVWSLPEIIAELSTLFTLAPGDLIFTGTPAGVGPVVKGDVLEGGIEGVGTLKVRVV